MSKQGAAQASRTQGTHAGKSGQGHPNAGGAKGGKAKSQGHAGKAGGKGGGKKH
jgi:hypothetical protein